tara:strand:- start:5740 stop:6606 length:867 start_codon:yes stop_codon:yes gene_type:complete
MSPEMVIAKALSGKLNFDPQTDVIETPKNEKIKLTPKRRQPIPKAGFVLNDTGYIKATAKKVALKIPTSERIKPFEAFDAWDEKDLENLYILCKSQGRCTTDQISPAGEWLKYRGNLDRISENLFLGVTNAFSKKTGTGINQITEKIEPLAKIAKKYSDMDIPWVLIGEENLGEGSSREHAALQPRYRNCKAVIAISFARIFENNLKRHGLLALTFEDPKDYEKIESSDRLSILNLLAVRPGEKIKVEIVKANKTIDYFSVTHNMSLEQIMWFKKGGAINYLNSKIVN